jgi:hypothetical protein
MRESVGALNALMMAASAIGIGAHPVRMRRPRPRNEHKPRFLKRSGWWVCECDGCKVRARTEAGFLALADRFWCPVSVRDLKDFEVDHV